MRVSDSADDDDDDDDDDEMYTIVNNNYYYNKPPGTTRRKLNLKTETKTHPTKTRIHYVVFLDRSPPTPYNMCTQIADGLHVSLAI